MEEFIPEAPPVAVGWEAMEERPGKPEAEDLVEMAAAMSR
jgi:hypothetical protein